MIKTTISAKVLDAQSRLPKPMPGLQKLFEILDHPQFLFTHRGPTKSLHKFIALLRLQHFAQHPVNQLTHHEVLLSTFDQFKSPPAQTQFILKAPHDLRKEGINRSQLKPW